MISLSYKAKFLLLNILFAVSIICIFLFGSLYTKNTSIKEISISNLQNKFDEREDIFLHRINATKDLINSIEDSLFFKEYLNTNIDNNIKDFFYSLVAMDKDILQLRYLDNYGYELVRVDKLEKSDKVILIPKENLQYKGSRDYFKYFSTLKRGEIGVSDIDLNQEFGKITETATIRFGKIIYKDNKKVGMLIINLNLNKFFEEFSRTIFFNMYLISKDGKFILFRDDVLPNRLIYSYFSKENSISILEKDEVFGVNFYARKMKFDNQQNIRLLIEFKLEDIAKSNDEIKHRLTLLALVLLVIYIPIIILLSNIPDKLLQRLQIKNRELNASIIKETQIQHQYKTLFETINDGIVIVDDIKEDILMCNESFEKMVGYQKDVIIKNNINIFYNAQISLLTLLKKQKDKEICLLEAIDISNSLGEKIYVDISISPIKINDKDYDIIVFRDITDKIKRDKELKSKDKILLQQSKMAAMGEMIGMIAHQWRQPLTALTALIQSIDLKYRLGNLDGDFIRAQSLQAKEVVNYMSATIDDFRDFFKPKSDKLDTSIKSLIDKAIVFVKPQLLQHSIIIEDNIKEDIKIKVYPNELMQVLLNIINNAKDALATKEGDKKIYIDIIKEENSVIIKIKDNAGGIPIEYISRIFEPYFSTKSKNGTGLGLYMSKIIVEEHLGGELSVQNIDGGAEFSIRIDL